MRYYIIDNKGNVLGDFESFERAKSALSTYTLEEIETDELEILEGMIEE